MSLIVYVKDFHPSKNLYKQFFELYLKITLKKIYLI
ncbi:hypothetical protein Bandiella_00802 [Candidatus Bandiella woodruffii]|uniref:Uncharacterized protein n=1 Tax=Candidatus Bandiella euplotis TaxID=1664265 RepID=A0ABZ0ULU7_9RICK|nr:hypothetical protein Bandiella_00802 [Candidatus Bandiella woodruffii]